MHELSVCEGLMGQVMSLVEQHHADKVESIHLRIGPLSGVDPHLLADAFPFASAGTPAEGAELVIDLQPVQVRCLTCGAETEAEPSRLVCGVCGDYRTRLMGGDELLLVSLELTGESISADNELATRG